MTARVRINLGIKDQHIDVAAAGQDVIEAAVTDVVGPAITADNPDAFADELVGETEQQLSLGSFEALELRFESGDALALFVDAYFVGLVGFQDGVHQILTHGPGEFLQKFTGELALFVDRDTETKAEFGER